MLLWTLGLAAQAGCHPPPSSEQPSRTATRDLGDIHGESKLVTWTCAGASCPWGASTTGHALVWPAATRALSVRLGYTVSAGMYLPAATANGATISSETDAVRVYAGRPEDVNHRLLGTLVAGQAFHVTGLAGREVLSVQADAAFGYTVALPPVTVPAPGDPAGAPHREIRSTKALWRCNAPGCVTGDWSGAVIAWPAAAAYQDNARAGDASRSVFAADGTPLYPYMGAWAQGCKVTAESGVVEIVEWQRGAEAWRQTWLSPGQSHVIDLGSREDGAMIETYEGSPGFSVSLENCTPQRIDH
jgi:hypothetical protein